MLDGAAQDARSEAGQELKLDGNAVAGLLREVFSVEMTASPAQCAHCGNVADMGTLVVYRQAPGAVLRCPGCGGIVLRIVETPAAIYLDARGSAYLRLPR